MKSQLEDSSSLLSTLDWVVFAATLLLTFSFVIFGEYKKRRLHLKQDAELLDLILMGRQLTLPFFIATLVATWYGGIFGVTKIAFEKGIYNFVTQGLFWYIAYIIFALFLVNRVGHYQALTLPDLVGKMFGRKSMYIAAGFNFFNVLPIAYAISLGLFGQTLFGGSLIFNMSIGVGITVLYSFFGGFRAVVYSDLIQFFVMCLGVFLVLFFSVYHYGGLDFLQANLPSTHFEATGGEGLATTLVWGFIALSTLVDPNFYQRCFAARSTKVARKGILISTGVWLCFDICTTFGAMYARALIPEADSSSAYLTYALQLLPDGLRGFMLAGILATILSTLDSYLFLAGTTVSFDLAPARIKNLPWAHHLGILLVGLLAILLATIFEGNIKSVWKTLGSYSASCLLLPVMAGHLFPGKIRDNQFVIACFLGIIGTTLWRHSTRTGFAGEIDELYIGLLSTICGLLLYPVIIKLTKKLNSHPH